MKIIRAILCSVGIHIWEPWSIYETDKTENSQGVITKIGISIKSQCTNCKKVITEHKTLR